MTIDISNRKKYDTIIREIDRETDFHLYTKFHEVLDAMDNSYARDEKGKHRYFYTGYSPEHGHMYMGFEVEELCGEARKVAQTFILEVASFFEVEVSYIDHITFAFF